MTHKKTTMTTLKIQPFKNPQTGNVAEMVIDADGLCTQYLEICTHGVVKAGTDHEEMYWASWTSEGEIFPSVYVDDCPCLDDALSGLESQLEAKDGVCPWHSETTGL
jgi:hypothetical protein